MIPCSVERKTQTTSNGFVINFAFGCTNNEDGGQVNGLYLRVLSGPGRKTPRMHPDFNTQLTDALLELPSLVYVILNVYSGQLHPQLGALSQLNAFMVDHYCMTGVLPPNLLYGWPDVVSLFVRRSRDAIGYLDPALPACGLR
jgi:hypothetical protein